jgi:transcriptional regulator with XRE-family HTH domain
MDTFGELVRKKRHERGISVRLLSEAISAHAGFSVSRSQINFIEIGKNLPTYRVALALAEELQIDTDKALRATFKDRVRHYTEREEKYFKEFLNENRGLKINPGRMTK